MIILTGKETKPELQSFLKENGIKFSQLDTKEKLIQLISDLNNQDEDEMLIVLSKAPGTNEILSQSEKNEFLKQITGSQYCNIKGYNNRTKFFIEKKYNDEYFLIEEWDEIFKKERLV